MLDLSKLDTTTASEAGSKMEITHPGSNILLIDDATGKPVTLTLLGQDSATYKQADAKTANKRLAQSRNGQRATLTAEGIDADSVERLIACTKGWEGLGWDGESKPCNPENARELYKRMPWLREQAESFIADRANFLKASPQI